MIPYINKHANKKIDHKDTHSLKEWVENKGHDFSNTRFRKSLDILNSCIDSNVIPGFDDRSIINELYDLKIVYDHYEDISPVMIKELKSGSLSLRDENKTRARDFMFEAKVSAQFKKSGFDIVPESGHDVHAINNGNIELFIECKRIQSISKMRANISKASEQLDALKEKKRDSGVIAVDFSKVIYKSMVDEKIDFPIDDESMFEFIEHADRKINYLIQKEIPRVFDEVGFILAHYSFVYSMCPMGIKKMNHSILIHRPSLSSVPNTAVELLREAIGKLD